MIFLIPYLSYSSNLNNIPNRNYNKKDMDTTEKKSKDTETLHFCIGYINYSFLIYQYITH